MSFRELFRSLFPKKGEKYFIVELERPRPTFEIDEESKKSITTLQGHPGFQYLAAKLKLQRSVLEAQLKRNRHQDIREVEFLQSGVFWTSWLEDQIQREVFEARAPALQEATDREKAMMEEFQHSVEIVGEK